MGSPSPPPAPTTYVPKPQAPTVFQSVIPDKDFDLAKDYINELKAEREKTKAERYLEVGTPEEIGQRMQRRENITEKAYESSLPQPEIDYTAGLDPAKLNNLETFLKDFVDQRSGRSALGKIKKGETAPAPAPAVPKVDTAKAVRQAVQAPKPKPAPRPAPSPAPAPAPAPRPAPRPAPPPAPKMQRVRIFGESISNAKKQNRKFGMGGNEMRQLRNYGDSQIYKAANEAGVPNVKTAADARKVLSYLKK